MAMNIIEDVIMPSGILAIITVGFLVIFSYIHDAKVDKAKEISPLYHDVITEYRDNCIRLKKNSPDQCADETIATAIANGYADKIQKIFDDVGFKLTNDQRDRLRMASPAA